MRRWETTSTLEAGVSPASVWQKAYADAAAWPKWNAEIKRTSLDGPLALDAKAKIVFGTGLRLAADHGAGGGTNPARRPARGGRAGAI